MFQSHPTSSGPSPHFHSVRRLSEGIVLRSAASSGRVQEELEMGRIQTAGLAIAAAAAMYVGAAPVAHADPPICGTPDRPCAGPSPLTPEQQCAFTAWRTMMPCNWLGQQVPQGTPGSWG
jgi:hypothetical protein